MNIIGQLIVYKEQPRYRREVDFYLLPIFPEYYKWMIENYYISKNYGPWMFFETQENNYEYHKYLELYKKKCVKRGREVTRIGASVLFFILGRCRFFVKLVTIVEIIIRSGVDFARTMPVSKTRPPPIPQ